MANAFSTLRQYGEYIQPYNFDLIQKGLEYKQQKFDVNMFKIQTEIDNIGNIDLVRDTDKEYLYNRLQKLVNSTNNFGSIDLSSDGVTRNIIGHINQAQDENVINAIIDTKIYRDKVNTINTIREKHRDKYSDINAMEAMEGLNNWVSSGKVGDRLNASDYTPYVDVEGKFSQLFEKLLSNKEQEFDMPVYDSNGKIVNGAKRRVKIKGMTDSEIRSIVNSQLNAQDLKQLEINGKWLYGKQLGADKTFELYNNKLKSKIDRLKNIKNSKNSSKLEKTTAMNMLNALESQINSVMPESNDSDSRIQQKAYLAGNYLAKDKVINSIHTMYGRYEAKNKLMKDDIYFANLSDQRAIDKLVWDKAKFEYKEGVNVDSNNVITSNNSNSNSNISNNVSIVPQSDNTVEVKDTEVEYKALKDKNYSDLKVAQNKLIHVIPTEQLEVFRRTAKSMHELSGISEFDAMNSVLKPYAMNLKDKSSDVYSNFTSLLSEGEGISNITKVSYEDSFDDLEDSLSETVPLFKEYFNRKINEKFKDFLDFDPTSENLTKEQKSELLTALAAEVLPGLSVHTEDTAKFYPLRTKEEKIKFNYIANKFNEVPKYNGDDIVESSIPKTVEYFRKANGSFIGRKEWTTGLFIGDDNLKEDSSADSILGKFDREFISKFKDNMQKNLSYFNDKSNVNIAPAVTSKEYLKNSELVKANKLFTESLLSNVVQYVDENGDITNDLPQDVKFDYKSGATIKMNYTDSSSLIINGNTRLLVPTDRVEYYFGNTFSNLNTDDGKALFVPDFNVEDVVIPKPSMKIDSSPKRLKYIEDKYSSVDPLAIVSEDKSLYLDDKVGVLRGMYDYNNGKAILNSKGKVYKHIIDNMDSFNMDINYSKEDLSYAYITIRNGDTKIGSYKYKLYNNTKSNKEALKKLHELAVDVPRVFLLRMLKDINMRGDNPDELKRIIKTFQEYK